MERLRNLLSRRPPNAIEVAVALAETLHRAGRTDELDALLAGGGAWLEDPRAMLFRARLEAKTDRPKAIRSALEVFRTGNHPTLRRTAGFEAVRLLETEGRHDEARAVAANVHQATTGSVDLGPIERDIAASHGYLDEVAAGAPCSALAPSVVQTALVIGLPRSGTTLVEQMLDRHPAISGIGEYEGVWAIREGLAAAGHWPDGLRTLSTDVAARLSREYLDGAAARRRDGAAWTFDKSLYQWRLLPALAAVLPGAAYVHIEREPRDCAISMHLSNFHPRSWSFTRDLAATRRVIELERGVVRRAIEVLGLRAVSIRYEDLVAAPERELRRVLALLGLEFDPAVLAPEENRRTVLTLSFEQVRQPIHAAAIGRWRHHAKAFDASWDAVCGASSPSEPGSSAS
ncbi:MAG: sulfotransferase [Planctomycetaceae bacterium]|nr:sulfotransferase [Planctomycetaceae bacterium]